jgi:hypothetical protein
MAIPECKWPRVPFLISFFYYQRILAYLFFVCGLSRRRRDCVHLLVVVIAWELRAQL